MNYNLAIASSGKGSRLGFDGAKCMAPIAGKPALSYQLDYWLTQPNPPANIAIIVQPKHEQSVADFLADQYAGFIVDVYLHSHYNGSANALAMALPSNRFEGRPLIAMWCDLIPQEQMPTVLPSDACISFAGPADKRYACKNGKIMPDIDNNGKVLGMYYVPNWQWQLAINSGEADFADVANRFGNWYEYDLHALDFGDKIKHTYCEQRLRQCN